MVQNSISNTIFPTCLKIHQGFAPLEKNARKPEASMSVRTLYHQKMNLFCVQDAEISPETYLPQKNEKYTSFFKIYSCRKHCEKRRNCL